jgi:hypothetical protein
VREIE